MSHTSTPNVLVLDCQPLKQNFFVDISLYVKYLFQIQTEAKIT